MTINEDDWTEIHIKCTEKNKRLYQEYKDKLTKQSGSRFSGNMLLEKFIHDSNRIELLSKDNNTRFQLLQDDLIDRCEEFDSIINGIKNSNSIKRLSVLSAQITDIINQMEYLTPPYRLPSFLFKKSNLLADMSKSIYDYNKKSSSSTSLSSSSLIA